MAIAKALYAALFVLALPLALLLFLQWPLRDLVHKFSREANDLGQVAFARLIRGCFRCSPNRPKSGLSLAAVSCVLSHRFPVR